MSDQNIPENETNFDFEGDMAPTDIHGFEYKNVFSPKKDYLFTIYRQSVPFLHFAKVLAKRIVAKRKA